MSFSRSLLILISVLMVSCANHNSNSSDEQLYGEVKLDTSDPRFAAAYAVLRNRCASCHEHAAWSSYVSDALWISKSNAVVKNNASASSMIQQIQMGFMPQNGSMPSSETQLLVDWINNMP